MVTKNWRYQFNVCVLFSTFDLCEVAIVADKLNLPEVAKSRPPLSIPGKLLVPSLTDGTAFAMLGLGDIVSLTEIYIFSFLYSTSYYTQTITAPITYCN